LVDKDFKVDGLAELERELQAIPEKMRNRVLASAFRAGASVYRAKARSLVPSRSGKLRRSIRISVRVRRGEVDARVTAGKNQKKDDPFYAHMVEFGTTRHQIAPKDKKGLQVGDGVVQGTVDHPGARERPFMRPAFDTSSDAALAAVAKSLRERIPKELGKK
jgi:HK97 gp10 family phage protein